MSLALSVTGYGHYLAVTLPPLSPDDVIAIDDHFDHRYYCRSCAHLVIIPGFRYRLVTRAELPSGLDCTLCGQHLQ